MLDLNVKEKELIVNVPGKLKVKLSSHVASKVAYNFLVEIGVDELVKERSFVGEHKWGILNKSMECGPGIENLI